MRRTRRRLRAGGPAVGPPVIQEGRNQSAYTRGRIDRCQLEHRGRRRRLRRVVAGLRRSAPVVLLLQEVYRGGDEVPGALPPGAAYAGRLGGRPGDSRYEQIEPIATVRSACHSSTCRRCEMGVDSRGRPRKCDPLESAVDRSRRLRAAVRAAAPRRTRRHDRRRTTTVERPGASASSMRISTTPSAPGASGWPRSTGRTRQARALVATLDTGEPLILGGDFNTWSGFSDQAYLTLARRFPAVPATDRRADFSRSAEARPPVLQARARMECNVPSRRTSASARITTRSSAPSAFNAEPEPVEPRRTRRTP